MATTKLAAASTPVLLHRTLGTRTVGGVGCGPCSPVVAKFRLLFACRTQCPAMADKPSPPQLSPLEMRVERFNREQFAIARRKDAEKACAPVVKAFAECVTGERVLRRAFVCGAACVCVFRRSDHQRGVEVQNAEGGPAQMRRRLVRTVRCVLAIPVAECVPCCRFSNKAHPFAWEVEKQEKKS